MITTYKFAENNWSQQRYDDDILFNSSGVHQPEGRHKTNSAKEQFQEIIPYLKETRNALDIGARWGSFTVQLHKFGFKHVYMAELRDIHFKGISYNVDMSRATLFPHPIMHKTSKVNAFQKISLQINLFEDVWSNSDRRRIDIRQSARIKANTSRCAPVAVT